VDELVRRGHDEGRQVVLEVVQHERAAVLAQRAEELHPQRVAGDHRGHARGHGQPGRHPPGRGRHRARAAGREHRDEQEPGDGRGGQDLLGDEQLRRHQQAQPQAAAHGAGTARRQPQDEVDHQRRQHGELQVVVADGGVQHRRGEPVDRAAERRGRRADVPAPQHGEHGQRGPGEPGRHEAR
jgi:hypothetical protein